MAAVAVALVVIAAAAAPAAPTVDDWAITGLLCGLPVAYQEFSRQVARANQVVMIARRGRRRTLYVSFGGCWTLAGVMLIPLPLVAIVIAVTYSSQWWRVTGHRVEAYRAAFTASAMLWAAAGGKGLQAVTGLDLADGRFDGHDLAATAAVVATCYVINYVLVALAVALSAPQFALMKVLRLPAWHEHAFSVCVDALGAMLAILVGVGSGWLALLWVPALVILYRGNVARAFAADAGVDEQTEVLNLAAWHRVAESEVKHSRITGQTVGLLLIDLDLHHTMHDLSGIASNEEMLAALAAAIRTAARPGDTVGRLGPTQFAVLAPAVDERDLEQMATTIEHTIAELDIVSVVNADETATPTAARRGGPRTVRVTTGSAICPRDAVEVADLLTVADPRIRSGRTPRTKAATGAESSQRNVSGQIAEARGSARG